VVQFPGSTIQLYGEWAEVEDLVLQYSGGGAKVAKEYLISNRNFQIPHEAVDAGRDRLASVDILRN